MKPCARLLFCPIFVAAALGAHLQAQEHVWHQLDEFRSLKDWTGDTSAWSIRGGSLRIGTHDYDQVLASPWWIEGTAPWTVEITMRGRRAGIFFALDDRTSKSLSHMIRFEDRSVMVGRFNGAGEFKATSTFEVSTDPLDWRRLRVEIDPVHDRAAIIVNDVAVGIDSQLVYPSGWFGLQASDGDHEFRSIVVKASAPPALRPPWRAKDRPRYSHIQFLEAHDKTACMYDGLSNTWVTPRADGMVIRTHAVRRKPSAVVMAIVGGKQFQIEGTRILVFRPRGTRAIDSITSRLARPFSIALTRQAMLVSDPGANAVQEFDLQGRFLRSHRARAIGGFRAPRGMAVLDDRRVAVADYDRVVIIEPGIDEPTLAIRTEKDGSALLQRSDRRSVKTVVVTDNESARIRRGRDGSVRVAGVAPMKTVHIRYAPAVETVPSSFSMSIPVAVTAPPTDPLMTAVRRLRLLYIVYRTIDYRDTYPADRFPQIPKGHSLTEEDIASLQTAVEFNREFYFRNSACRLSLDFDFFVVNQPLKLADVGDRDPYWLEPRDRISRDVDSAASHFGRAPASYDGVLCTYAWQNYPPRRPGQVVSPAPGDSVQIRQAYGGGTYGVPAPWKYGATAGYTGNPFQDRFSRQDWLITHEFHHQLDALMEQSGFADYDHADQPWTVPGAFGEDFDFNAQILRRAPLSSWTALRFGSLAAVRDADRDGIPDADPSLPMDERRFGSRADRADSDRDGLSDLKELMAGTSHSTSPTTADTDSDGIVDGMDREPLSPLSFTIAPMNANAVPIIGKKRLGSLDVVWSMGWTPDSLVVEMSTSAPASILFQLDADNDGWFHGADNVQIRIVSEGDSVRVADAYLRDCSSWIQPPKDRRDLLTPADIRFQSWRIRTASVPALRGDVIRFVIPRSEKYGRVWEKGRRVALRCAVQAETDLWVWDEFFERNDMPTFQLR